MQNSQQNNKRIAKNTILLYVRMILVMGVTLYTSRIILRALGVSDYGIYNVVGGVVSMFGFINTSLGGASSRFITYALGKGDKEELQKIFNCVVTIHYLIALIVLVLAETIGLWFVTEKLVIPEGREPAAFWVYQSSVLAAFIMLASTPFNGLIIAHERMGAFAYISIFETLSKLLICFLLFIIPFDRLIVYSVLIVLTQTVVRLLYTFYCNKHFEESHYKLVWDKEKSKKIFAYAGWTMNGELAIVGYTQGLNILLNLFFGPVVNASRGIAVQVQGAVMQFFKNFQVAVRPQIIKSYAQGDFSYMHKLVLSCSRYSFYLMLIVSLPVLFQTEYILKLWLGTVPDHCVAFIQIMMFVGMNYTFNTPTTMALHATGNIKRFQIIEGTMLLSVVPVAYILLKYFHISPESVFITYFFIEIVTQIVRVIIIYPMVKMPISYYFTKVMWPIVKVCSLVWIPPLLVNISIPHQGFIKLIVMCIVCVLSTMVCVYVLGMNVSEREFMVKKVKAFKGKFWMK